MRKIPQTRAYSVFNVDQCDGLPETLAGPSGTIPESVAQDQLMRCIVATGAKIEYRGNKAAYLPNRDIIVMPPYETFKDAEGFFGTLSHETVHWTGAKERLSREFGKRFGDEKYAAEELVAELGAAYLCATHGVPATFRSAQYIASWIKVLENDSRAIFTAASYASQAVTFIRSTEQSDVDELEEELDRLEAAE
ncbi:zincin-like metallopeptidase domain-containing protein [Methylopila sp. 73B]|uniref:ArdC family protein n=1 Tax=Methylopila sp. 73B TaxID=1120792 RepID=UPI0003729784|nr:zincin-like metallopeptidase domain-containing protein [Methylopila sp. 73B]